MFTIVTLFFSKFFEMKYYWILFADMDDSFEMKVTFCSKVLKMIRFRLFSLGTWKVKPVLQRNTLGYTERSSNQTNYRQQLMLGFKIYTEAEQWMITKRHYLPQNTHCRTRDLQFLQGMNTRYNNHYIIKITDRSGFQRFGVFWCC